MDAREHIKREEMLRQTLGDKLDQISKDLEETMTRNNIDLTFETAYDIFIYTQERIHLKRFNHLMFEPQWKEQS